jgi:hypothetical protein
MAKQKLTYLKEEYGDVDYWDKLSREKTIKLKNGEMISEYEWLKKFIGENYGSGFDRDNTKNNILRTKKQKAQAIRNNNTINRDALTRGVKKGIVTSLLENKLYPTSSDLNEEQWEIDFKESTYTESFISLCEQCCEELGFEYSEESPTKFLRIYLRVKRFFRMVRQDKGNK